MNKNFSEQGSLRKKSNDLYLDHNKIYSTLRVTEGDDDSTNIIKKAKRGSQNYSNKRFQTPISTRYDTQSYNKKSAISYSHLSTDINNNNYSQYQDMSGNFQSEKDNDVSYYKNLYMQTKNNLNKEKQKNEENQKNLMMYSNLKKENSILKDKIKSLTTQLDRLINLVEKSNSQNMKNMSMKQEEINKLNSQLESLMKSNNLMQMKNREEKESLANTIKQLNSNNQNTQLTIKNYQNKIEHISQISNSEINSLKEQILNLNKNLTLCINEKNKNDQKNKEIIQELKNKLNENENNNAENKQLINELNEYKNNFNDLKLRYSNLEMELDTLKNMEQNYNKLVSQFNIIQSDNTQNLKTIDINKKMINDLKIKLNASIEELNKMNKENEDLAKEIIEKRKKEKDRNKDDKELAEIKNEHNTMMKELEIKNMKIKI